MKRRKIKIVLIFFLALFGMVVSQWDCRPGGQTALPAIAVHYDGSAYAGSESCRACHAVLYEDHLKTAHYLTSREADWESVEGSFVAGENEMALSDRIVYRMIEEDGRLYQAAYVNGNYMARAPFDIVVGSGTKGQSYLYWFEDELKQLPVSYQTAGDQWIHSPGYPSDKVDFGRPVIPTCLTCHMTFAKNRQPEDFFSNRYVQEEMIMAVNCESCHGPSLAHVNFHLKHPEEKEAGEILAIASLDRQRRLDACAKCHSGLREPTQKPFSFQTGDVLADFSEPGYQAGETAALDVHGNQYGLLTASRCFQMSPSMDCRTCHDPHRRERGDLKLFSTRCMSCHQEVEDCKMGRELGPVIADNCIDCHMPGLPSANLLMRNTATGKIDSLWVRTHHIALYPDATRSVVKYIENL